MDEIIGTKAAVTIGDAENHSTETGTIVDWFMDDNLKDWYRVKLDSSSFTVTVPFERVAFSES